MCDDSKSIKRNKSQIFKKELNITYILNFFVENFKLIKIPKIGIDISYIESKYLYNSNTSVCDVENDVENKDDLHFHINKILYKKMKYHGKIQPFFDYMTDYYYQSKKIYATKEPTYKSFITIIRQLCKYFGFKIESNIKYTKSTYEINYDIVI